MTCRSRLLAVTATCLALLLVAGPAFAHVTVRVDNPATEAFAKYTVRVPNESDDASTVRIEVELPEGFEGARYQPLAGWQISIDDGVMTMEGGEIGPDQFQEFHFSARNPEQPGDVAFRSIQTYDDGEEVRWVGDPDSEEPAPVVTIEDPATSDDDAEETAEEPETVEPTTPAAATEEPAPTTPAVPDDAGTERAAGAVEPTPTATTSNTLAVVALVVAVIALALGGAAFARARKPTA